MSTTPIEDPEVRWIRETYRPDEPQLTVRAVVAGMVIGGVMCLSNLYVVLKTGWSLGVTLTACIAAFATFQLLRAVGLSKREFGILENNAMGSVASAAGYMTGGGNMAALPALVMLTGVIPPGGWLVAWFAVIAAMGVFVAIPIKRQLVNRERLAFPTGTATAETLKSMHVPHDASPEAKGSGSEKGRLLFGAGIAGLVIAWFRDAKGAFMPFNIPGSVGLPFQLGGLPASRWTLAFDGSLILVGVGALMSFRTGWSLLLGGLLNYAVLAPLLVSAGLVKVVAYKDIVNWTLWPGAAILVSSGILSFLFEWRSIVQTLSAPGIFSRRKEGASGDDPVAAVECPNWWFPAGFLLLSPFVIYLMWRLFAIPLWVAVFTVPLAVVMGFIASRVTGDTDVTPTKALGPVTQGIYGALVPGNLPANVMGANVTGGIGLHAADLLTDLKSGYLLGANPRKQLVGQLFGVVAGAVVVVPAFALLVPEASVLGSEELPAPAALVWAGVSKAMAGGAPLDGPLRIAVVVGLLLGAVLQILERYGPKGLRPFVPSPSGLGIAMVIPGKNSIAMFLGALIAEVLRRKRARLADRTVVPIAAGLIAGESLMGVLVAALVVAGVLQK